MIERRKRHFFTYCGGGQNGPTVRRYRQLFSTETTKKSLNSWFFLKLCWIKGSAVILSKSWMAVQKSGWVCQKLNNFSRQKSWKWIFFKIFIVKPSDFTSNLNYWYSENFFEVLHASLAQKLTNLEFLSMIFSDVAIGHFARSLRPN